MDEVLDRPVAHAPNRYERGFAAVVLVALLVTCLALLAPFLSALLWAIVLSFALWPVQKRLIAALRGRRSLAALVTTLAITAALVVPLITAIANLSDDAHDLALAAKTWIDAGIQPSPQWLRATPVVGAVASRAWDTAATRFNALGADLTDRTATVPTSAPIDASSRTAQTIRALLQGARTWLIAFGLAIGNGVLQVVLSLFFVFFILRDAENLALRVRNGISRMFGVRGDKLVDVAAGTVRGVIYGILGTAAVQGVMAGVGFLVAGVPGATLLGLLTFFLSVVPAGPPLIWIPVAVWLFHSASIGWGVFMVIWGIAVSSIDNVVKPMIISRGSNMPFVLIFLGVLGGAVAFGLIGIFIGPTFLAVAYRVLEEWSSDRPAMVPTS